MWEAKQKGIDIGKYADREEDRERNLQEKIIFWKKNNWRKL